MNLPELGDVSPEAVGRRLVALRASMGFGERQQKAFADFLGLGVTRYNSYETGKQRPPIPVALTIVAKTAVNLDWLYRGVEDLLPYHLVQKLHSGDPADRRRA